MNLEEQIKAYKDLGQAIEEFEQQRKALGIKPGNGDFSRSRNARF